MLFFWFCFVLVFLGFFVSLERKERCSVLNVKVYKLLCYNKTKCVHKGAGWSSLKETVFISYLELAGSFLAFLGAFGQYFSSAMQPCCED